MAKTIVIVGALDTKGPEFAYLKAQVEKFGHKTLVVDFGVMGEAAFTPEVARTEVAQAGGGDLAYLASGGHKDEAMQVMAQGLTIVVRRLYDEGKLDGIIGMGGSGGTSIATSGMRALPVGLPKVMVSTVGGGNVGPYAGTKDIAFIPSIVDIAGLNRISRVIYDNAAGAISGMVQIEPGQAVEGSNADRPLVVASMFGNTTTAVDHARALVEAAGYEVLVFHATGIGGQTMESLISDGYILGSMDITTTELADTVCGGIFDAGAERCMAASKAGIPAVIVPGCVDMANFGGLETVPAKYHQRNLYQWNPEVTLLRTNIEENIQIGHMIAAAANQATAPVTIILPLNGLSMLDSEGERFWDPEADKACFETIKQNIRSDILVLERAQNINDPEFSGKVAETLLAML